MTALSRLSGAAALLVPWSLVVPGSAQADDSERGSGGVLVTVLITSLGGGETPSGGLPATGSEPAMWMLWLALALVGVGTGLIARRALRARSLSRARPAVRVPYNMVTAHDVPLADGATQSAPRAGGPSRVSDDGRET